jgi:hypothetical protein
MNVRIGITSAVAGAAALLLSGPVYGAADVANCSKKINQEGAKIQAGALKAFAGCNDAWRKQQLGKATLAKAAADCQKSLDTKFFGAGKTLDKEFAKTAALAPASCTDANLSQLGHLPTAQFGNRWAVAVTLDAVQAAYDQQIMMTRDWVNIMSVLGGLTPDPATGETVTPACALCAKYANSPCQEHSCTYVQPPPAAQSAALVSLNEGTLEIPVPLMGTTALNFCNTGATNLLDGITTLGEYPVFGEAGKQLLPANIPGVGYACVKAIGAEGFLSCKTSGNTRVDYTTCQDHTADVPNAAGSTSSGECASQTLCLQSAADIGNPGSGISKHDNVTNGGACIALSPAAGAAGEMFVNNTTQIVVTLSTQVGNDGLRCTNDDTPSSPGTPGTTSLTTGTANTQVIDADNVEGSNLVPVSGSVTGSVFPCNTLASSTLSGGQIAGAFPALHALIVGGTAFDSVTTFEISCQ